MGRHTCNICKRKRFEKFMFKTEYVTRYGKSVWVCSDNKFHKFVFDILGGLNLY